MKQKQKPKTQAFRSTTKKNNKKKQNERRKQLQTKMSHASDHTPYITNTKASIAAHEPPYFTIYARDLHMKNQTHILMYLTAI